MNWLRFLRPRGLFVKQAVSFFLVFSAVRFVAGMIDVWMLSARFERADPATTQAKRFERCSDQRRAAVVGGTSVPMLLSQVARTALKV
ncbi:hypothetical protein RDV84_05415 [Lysobacter yananisis]|uniref:Uncharacterized protein n=1 Tax=Lysobacter yananisis TaxID=1003114 RepID=A0ABY9PB57_9GAMM|nr:hypothetical protein [Lysobacter yananisis]WMT04277.1 hypothetical protein RDV84_05415 [Lysobacter yananisis]